MMKAFPKFRQYSVPATKDFKSKVGQLIARVTQERLSHTSETLLTELKFWTTPKNERRASNPTVQQLDAKALHEQRAVLLSRWDVAAHTAAQQAAKQGILNAKKAKQTQAAGEKKLVRDQKKEEANKLKNETRYWKLKKQRDDDVNTKLSNKDLKFAVLYASADICLAEDVDEDTKCNSCPSLLSVMLKWMPEKTFQECDYCAISTCHLCCTTVKKFAELHTHEEIVKCVCDKNTDNGYMISCDSCKTWQHGRCVKIKKNQAPDVYVCPPCVRAEELEAAELEAAEEDFDLTQPVHTTHIRAHTCTHTHAPIHATHRARAHTHTQSHTHTHDKMDLSIDVFQ